jgi:hypothetical protein
VLPGFDEISGDCGMLEEDAVVTFIPASSSSESRRLRLANPVMMRPLENGTETLI